ncbi:MAG: multidrug efflux SMR transporter [Alphaproteobacteria bacterium]|nr:multidrug efflux SMR transporter [Alphaproteobacteria bacterium]
MHWLFLAAAILCEVAGTICMKLSEGFAKPVPSVLVFVFYCIGLAMVTYALKKIDLSVAYTIWGGVGTTLVALIGIYYFGEAATTLKFVSIGLVIAGIVGLKLSYS